MGKVLTGRARPVSVWPLLTGHCSLATAHWPLLTAVLFLAMASAAATTSLPGGAEELRIDQRLGEQVPLQLTFRDEQGKSQALQEYFQGKPVVLVLAYYRCPRLCSLVLHNLVESLSRVPLNAGEDYQVVIVSFDPRETPELAAANKALCLERYGRPQGENGWHFLTGEEQPIGQLADAVGFHYRYDPESQQYQHASGIMLLTPQGKVARYLFGVDYNPRDLRLGLVEASENLIGSPVDNALLLTCLAFDPETGRYSLAALKLMRTAGAVTVSFLGIFLGWNWLRKRQPLSTRGGRAS